MFLERKSELNIVLPGLCNISTFNVLIVDRKAATRDDVENEPDLALLAAKTTGKLSVKCNVVLLLDLICWEKCSRTSFVAKLSPSHEIHLDFLVKVSQMY